MAYPASAGLSFVSAGAVHLFPLLYCGSPADKADFMTPIEYDSMKRSGSPWPGQAQILLMIGLIVLIGLWTSPVPAQEPISDGQVAALVEALRLAAPKTGREDDGLYSDWQIKPNNITRWSRRCLGVELSPQEFEANPITAREVVTCVMGDVLRDQYMASNYDETVAIRRAAAWWMTGDPEQYDSGSTQTYTLKVLDYYQTAILGYPASPAG